MTDISEKDQANNKIITRAIASANIGLFGYLPDGTIEYINQKAFVIFDLHERFSEIAEVIGKKISDLINLTEPEGIFNEDFIKHDFEFSLITLMNKKKYILSDSYVSVDEKIQKNIVNVVCRDITEVKENDQLRCEEDSRVQRYFDLVKNIIVTVNADQIVTFINKIGCEALGHERKDIIGSNWFDNYVPKDLREADKQAFNKSIQLKDELVKHFDSVIINNEKERRTIKWRRISLRNKKGNVISTINSGEDITERKLRDDELKKHIEQVDGISASTYDGIILMDDKANVVFWNDVASEIYGYTRDEIIGKNLFKAILPKRLQKQYIDNYKLTAKTGKGEFVGKTSEITVRKKDGSEFPVGIAVSSLKFKDKWHTLAIARDITEQLNLEEALKKVAAGVKGTTSQEVFNSLVKHLCELTDSDIAFIGKINNEFNIVRTIAVSERGTPQENFEYDLKGTPCEKVLSGADYSFMSSVQKKFPDDELLVEMGIESYVGSRLKDSLGNTLGVIAVLGRKPFETSRINQTLLEVFASRASAEIERLNVEQELKESEEKIQSVISLSPVGITVYDCSGQSVSANDAIASILRTTKEKVLAQNFNDIKSWKVSGLYDKAKEALQNNITIYHNAAITTSSGEDVLLDCSLTPFGACGLLVMAHDVTERNRVEEERKKDFLNHIGAMIVALHPDGAVYFINSAGEKTLGYDKEEIIGKNWFDNYIPERLRSDVRVVFNKLMSGKIEPTTENYENPILTRDGEERVLFWNNVILKDDSGNISGILSTGEDVTSERRTEKELKRAQNILSETSYGVSVQDLNFKVLYQNKAHINMVGVHRGEYCYNAYEQKEDVCDGCPVAQAFADGNSHTTVRSVVLGYKLRHFEITAFPLKDSEGKITEGIEMVTEITDKIETVNALKESEEKFKRIIINSQAIIFMIDKNGDFVLSEGKALSVLGLKPGEIVGQSAFAIYKDNPTIISGINKALSGETYKDIININGLHFDIFYSPYRDNTGEIAGCIGMAVDITERVNAEEIIKNAYQNQLALDSILEISIRDIPLEEQLEESLSVLFAVPWLKTTSTGSIFLVDKEEDVLVMVAQHGLSKEILTSCSKVPFGHCLCGKAAMNNKVVFSNKLTDDHTNTYDGILSHGHYNVPIVLKEKVVGVINLYIAEGHEYDEKEVAFLEAISHTLSGLINRKQGEEERERLWQQLLHSQKMDSIGRLTGGISHDFNNLLSGIMGFSELAMLEVSEDSKVYERLKVIEESCEKAAKLTNQLLAFSRKQMLEVELTNFNTIIENIGKMLIRVIGEDIALKMNTKTPVQNIMADATQIEQVLMNLAVNARHAMPDGGTLTISTENIILDEDFIKFHNGANSGKFVLLTVSDTGTGMSKEVQEKMFEPFFTTKGKGKGTGLGLSTVFGIVKQHEGYITVDSELGEGTTVKIYLPAIEKEVTAKEVEARVEIKGGEETILVADDEYALRSLVSISLKHYGYTTLVAESGEEALKICDSTDQKISLLITDVIMTGITGWELYEKVLERNPDIKVIFISGYIENQIILKKILKNKMPFIKKPFKPVTIITKVREVLDSDS
ncbi:PAS domain S-box protein [Thermodesulfobacteriota bacterium]